MSKAIRSGMQSLWPPMLLAWLALLYCLPVLAQDALFTSNVSVDITAEDMAKARAEALEQAKRLGLAQLLDKLAPDQKDAVMNGLDAATLSGLVHDAEVAEEKLNGSRYNAQIRVNYNALGISRLLAKHVNAEGIPDELAHSTSLLILPVYEENGSLMLWEDGNPWREAWNRVALEVRGGNLIVPYADSVDSEAMTPAEAMSANFSGFARFISRYGVGGVIVLKAVLRTEPSLSLYVIKRQVTRQVNDALSFEYQADPQEDKEALLLRAARDLAAQIDKGREELLSRRAPEDNAKTQVMAVTPIVTLDSWTTVRRLILNVPAVEKLDVLAVGPRQVDTLIHFKGDKAGVLQSLRASGLTVQEVDNYWIISHE